LDFYYKPGGDLELLAVNGESVVQPNNKKNIWKDSAENITVMWTRKTLKAHLWRDVHTFDPGETNTLLLTVKLEDLCLRFQP